MRLSPPTHSEPSTNHPSDVILLTLTVPVFPETLSQAKAAHQHDLTIALKFK
jgi:hypothetical protein